MKENALNLFFGRLPSDDDFFEDLETLKKFQENEVLELIDKIIEWYTDDETLDKKWEEWKKGFSEEELEERKKIIRILLFIFKEFVSENIDKDELKEDFETLELSKNYLDKFFSSIKPIEQEFHKKSLRGEKPYENYLLNIDWRIDNKKYRDGTEKNATIIEFIYSDKGEKKIAQFELNLKALRHLIYRLQKIEEKL